MPSKTTTRFASLAGDAIEHASSQPVIINGFTGLVSPSTTNALITASKNSRSDIRPSRFAANQIAHATEAFCFLSMALTAYTRNLINQATHFAYYAELRSTMSLLSGEGICVNNNDNYYLRSDGTVQRFEGKTHEITWELWNKWENSTRANDLLGNLSLFTNIQLKDLIAVLGIQTAGSSFLKKLGFDLSYISYDHKQRNNASYRTDFVTKSFQPAPDNKIITTIAKLLTPHSSLTLNFEIALMRYLLSRHIQSKEPTSSKKRSQEHEHIISLISHQTGERPDFIRRILVAEGQVNQNNNAFFADALKQDSNIQNILCRAAILCRLALFSLETNIKRQPSSCKEPMIWINNWLFNNGLINDHQKNNMAACRDDICSEFTDAIDQVDDYNFQFNPRSNWEPEIITYLQMLSRVEYAFVWSSINN